MTKKSIVLFDNSTLGHHLSYIRLYSKVLLDLGHHVIVCYPEPDQVRHWIIKYCPNKVNNFYTFEIKNSMNSSFTAISQWPILKRFYKPLETLGLWIYTAKQINKATKIFHQKPDLVFLNWLDSYFSHYLNDKVIDFIFPYYWSGLYFQVSELRSDRHTIPLFNKTLTHYQIAHSLRCKAISILVEQVATPVQKKIRKPVFSFPDITDITEPDKTFHVRSQILAQSQQRSIIGLVGVISKRKGLLTLIESAKQTRNKNLFFVIAGQFFENGLSESEIKYFNEFVSSQPDNCFFHLQKIPSESQFNALISICHVIFAAYEKYPYSSNLITKAAIFEKPLIVSQECCMGKRVKDFELGLTIPEGSVEACIMALDQLCHCSNFNHLNLKFDYEGYRALHSIQTLKQRMQSLLVEYNID